MYYVVIGFTITMLVSLTTSLFFESNVTKLNPKLFVSIVSNKVQMKVNATRKKHSTTSKTVTFSLDA